MAAWGDSYHVVGLADSQFRQLCQVNICFIQLHSGSFMQTAVPLLIHEVNLIRFGFGISPSPFLALGVAAATAAQPAEVAVSDIPTTTRKFEIAYMLWCVWPCLPLVHVNRFHVTNCTRFYRLLCTVLRYQPFRPIWESISGPVSNVVRI